MAIKVGGVLVIDDARGAAFSGLNLIDTVANKTGSMRFTVDGGFQTKLPDATEWQAVGSGDIDGNLGKKIQHIRKLAADWTTANPVLSDGEIGYETDTGKFKFGNGTATWTALPYSSTQAGSTSIAGVLQLTDSVTSTSITTAATPNSVKIAYDLANIKASTSQVGTVQLTDSVSSNSTTTAATPNSVKTAYDLANSKQDALVSGTTIKTINGSSLLGEGDLQLATSFSVVENTASVTPVYPLMTSANSGNISTSNVSSSKCYFIPSSGTFAATQFMSLSDVTKKFNISSIVNGLDVISGLRGVTFNYMDDGTKSSGVIAQELEELLPFLVNTNPDGTKTVNYSGIIGYLIEAVKELKKEISILSKM